MEKIDLKVASDSNPSTVAGSIAKNIEERKEVNAIAVGAGAVNQAVKAIAIARGYVAPQGINLLVAVGFSTVIIEDKERTAIKFHLICQ